MSKDRDVHIKMTVERYKIIKKIADKSYRKVTAIIDMALDEFLEKRER